jgi:putative protease
MTKKMELLAPAGTEAAFLAALRNGADAIYLGAGPHHARQFSGGFSEPVFFSLVDQAHGAGARVYLTLNTLLGGQELPSAMDWAFRAWQGGVDAIIVQDIGLARLLRHRYPDITLHASTQMSLHNAEGVLAAREAGISRVVLARELSIGEIADIREQTDTELEVFGHGALCVSYSGQCLMSSMIGGRSGNRGTCAQPCRLPWRLRTAAGGEEAGGYLLSMKDLMSLPLLPQLTAAGVTALKIEGRMKSPEYVALVTGVYRKYLELLETGGTDAFQVDPADLRMLAQTFNRGGFTRRYLAGGRLPVTPGGADADAIAGLPVAPGGADADAIAGPLVDPTHPKNKGVRIGSVVSWRAPYVTVRLSERVTLGDGLEIHRGGLGGEQAVSMMLTAILNQGAHVREAEAGLPVQLGDVRTPVAQGDPVYRTSRKELLLAAAEQMAHWQVKRVRVHMSAVLRIGEPARLTVWDDDGHEVAVQSDLAVAVARERPLDRERLVSQLFKTGDAPWQPLLEEVTLDDGAILPVSAINAMRRHALDVLWQARVAAGRPEPDAGTPARGEAALPVPRDCGTARATLAFSKPPTADWLAAAGLTRNHPPVRLLLPLMTPDALAQLRQVFAGQLWVRLPAIVPQGRMKALLAALRRLQDEGVPVDGFSAGNPGLLRLLRRLFPDKPLLADEGMNLWNPAAIRQAADWGADMALLSAEIPPEAVAACREALSAGSPVVLPVCDWTYGRVRVMTTAHCPGTMAGPCDRRCAVCPRSEGTLTDRAGAVFPWFRDPLTETTAIYHSQPIRRTRSERLHRSDCVHLQVTDEAPQTMAALLTQLLAMPD